ncbi:DnaD domain-containing protein [Vagococcus vulneris]|uniref:Uncharacterized protein n=1 Tax=Vagococcus vulneris TaxID=1977869 RepID=A0A429ZWN8_9ENTE|nr:DnaD domain protein [Vagococcus vulneris]RST98217.1 hypothetical protein CBF37_08590 [Vagococcus vulneris]
MDQTLKYLLTVKQTVISNFILDYYRIIGMTDEEFILFMQLMKYNQQGIYFPELSDVSYYTGYSTDKIFQLIQTMVNKKYLSIETKINEQEKKEDYYDLTLIFDKIILAKNQNENKQVKNNHDNEVSKLFQQFEKEFGRPLSPMELETINLWLTDDHYQVDIILLALREAVLNQAYSLKYIDRILLSWERKNLTSKQQIQEDQKKRLKAVDEKRGQTTQEEILPDVPLFNWLNPNERGE